MFSDLLSRYSTTIDPRTLLINLLIAVVLGYAVSLLYLFTVGRKDRRLARLFPVMTAATALASTLIASSLGIAIGLVGAMSIVRFRNVTPGLDQSAFLFLAIGMGLAGGTGHVITALIAMVIIAPVFYWRHRQELKQIQHIQLDIRGERQRVESFMSNFPVQIPGLRLASMEQVGTQMNYRFTFPTNRWDQVVSIQKQMSGQNGLKISFSSSHASDA